MKLCDRCPQAGSCLLNYLGKACHKLRMQECPEVVPTTLELMHNMDAEELAAFLSKTFCQSLGKTQLLEWLNASVVSFTITPALDTVSRAEMESALAEHNTNGTSHSDIRALALNAVQQGDVYTKPEVNALVGGAVNEHNNSDTAHASIRVDLTGLDSRLKTLELKYGTNVTGSSFEVTFVTLTDVVVTGVWNEELGRIEF